MLYPKTHKPLSQLNGTTGEVETTLSGGERIFSIPHTKELVTTSLKAKSENDYGLLGKRVIEIIEQQDQTKPEYV